MLYYTGGFVNWELSLVSVSLMTSDSLIRFLYISQV